MSTDYRPGEAGIGSETPWCAGAAQFANKVAGIGAARMPDPSKMTLPQVWKIINSWTDHSSGKIPDQLNFIKKAEAIQDEKPDEQVNPGGLTIRDIIKHFQDEYQKSDVAWIVRNMAAKELKKLSTPNTTLESG